MSAITNMEVIPLDTANYPPLSDRVGVETITIDDTIDEKETSDYDFVIIVHDDDESVQEIADRYHVPMTAITNMEFIPLDTANYPLLSVRIQNQRKGNAENKSTQRKSRKDSMNDRRHTRSFGTGQKDGNRGADGRESQSGGRGGQSGGRGGQSDYTELDL